MNVLFDSVWFGPLFWAALYVSDYYLTFTCARPYAANAREKIVFGGSFELNPYYQKDIDSLRRVSPRFLWALCLTVAGLAAVWWLVSQSLLPKELYALLLGALVLIELAIHQRHMRNLFLFRALAQPDAAQGRIEYSRPLILKQSSLDLLCFAGLFLFLGLSTRSFFVLGGTASCLSQAIQNWRLARKASAMAAAGQT